MNVPGYGFRPQRAATESFPKRITVTGKRFLNVSPPSDWVESSYGRRTGSDFARVGGLD